MNILLFNSSKSKGSNTDILIKEFKNQASFRKHKVFEIGSKEVPHCLGCRRCVDLGKCVIQDRLTEILSTNKFDVFIFCGPVYFFSLNSELLKTLERMFSIDMSNKIIGLILTSGSNFRYGGVDLIISQFKRIDEYCGSITLTPYNKVTYDKKTPLNECDMLGIDKLLNDIEYALEKRLIYG